jgi:hypothetical protein
MLKEASASFFLLMNLIKDNFERPKAVLKVHIFLSTFARAGLIIVRKKEMLQRSDPK